MTITTKKPRILLVDNDSNSRATIEFELRKENYEFYQANNGVEAMDILENNDINLVITDTDMPEMDGVYLLESIMKHWPTLPVIVFFSGYSLRPEVDESFLENLGAKFILSKPEGFMQIRELVLGLVFTHN